MKWLFLLAVSAMTIISSCGSGEDKNDNTVDSGNMLQDTLPARPADSLPLDSNPPDGTKTDTGKGDFN